MPAYDDDESFIDEHISEGRISQYITKQLNHNNANTKSKAMMDNYTDNLTIEEEKE
jgi:hypothetical protein